MMFNLNSKNVQMCLTHSAGLYLADKNIVKEELRKKFENSNLFQKYFITKIEPNYEEELKKLLLNTTLNNSESILLNYLLHNKVIDEIVIDTSLYDLIQYDIDIIKIIFLQDISKALLKIKYVNQSAEELLRKILQNFSNAIQKIIKDRRKNHPEFEIKDEYDVQDILYVIIKTIFPNLKDEDPIPKHGGSSTRIDLILREEQILIEIKMIKENDRNEKEIIKQLKNDIESYHICPWLKKLFCFVYDPYKKTTDIKNFEELNGERIKGNHNFDVELVVLN